MTPKLKRLLTGTRALESRLAAAFETAARTMVGAEAATALELADLACDEIATHVQPAGRGRYAFPFNRATVTFVAPTPEAQAYFEAICAGPPSLHDRIARRLASAGCDTAGSEVDLTVAFAVVPDAAWTRPEFHVALARVNRAPRPVPEPALCIDLLVTHGTADRGAYSFTTLPIAIGRGEHVRDSRHQLLRINHVAFTEDGGDVNRSVSRRHARIELDRETGRARLIDDNSAQGTSVIRSGRGIAVPRGSRGLGLHSDDEIVLGEARLKVRIG
jgi:hypothetical protein